MFSPSILVDLIELRLDHPHENMPVGMHDFPASLKFILEGWPKALFAYFLSREKVGERK